MIRMSTRVHVPGLRGSEVADFMLNPTDESYRGWWPGMHFSFHVVEPKPGHLGEIVFMDEMIGTRRLRMKGLVERIEPGTLIVWRFIRLIRLPVRLCLEMKDIDGGVEITHTIQAGGRGFARVFDPLFRLYFSPGFARAMEEHAQTEFPLLAERIGRKS